MSRDSRKQNMTKKECENNGHCCKMTAANFIEMLQLINDCIDVINMHRADRSRIGVKFKKSLHIPKW
jgi:hypothetical protein